MNGWRIVLAAGMLLCTAVQAAEVGEPAPAFSGEPLQSGAAVSLEQFRGKIVYLDFWASWCGPCRHSLPWLSQMRSDYAARGFEVIAVNVDEQPQDGLDFLKKYPVTYPTVRDAEGRIAHLYDVKTMPMSYLIDRQGVVRLVHQGFNKKDTPQLRAAVTQLLGENP
jgi:thiol-disulfide isomerase/thioredoxin